MNNNNKWIENMLEDPEILSALGLSSDIDENMKKTIKNIILNDITSFEYCKAQFSDPTDNYDSSKSPIENFLEEAVETLKQNSGQETEVRYDALEVGKKYKIYFPNNTTAIVILNNIKNNSFGNDYIFKNIEGADNLVGKSSILEKDEFPLPIQLLKHLKFGLIS